MLITFLSFNSILTTVQLSINKNLKKSRRVSLIPCSSISVWSYGGRMLCNDPVPRVQSKLSAKELLQPQRPLSKLQEVPQSFSSVPLPQSSVKSQLCIAMKQRPFSQDRESGGQESGGKDPEKVSSYPSRFNLNLTLE